MSVPAFNRIQKVFIYEYAIWSNLSNIRVQFNKKIIIKCNVTKMIYNNMQFDISNITKTLWFRRWTFENLLLIRQRIKSPLNWWKLVMDYGFVAIFFLHENEILTCDEKIEPQLAIDVS